jgi:hypothetical protein
MNGQLRCGTLRIPRTTRIATLHNAPPRKTLRESESLSKRLVPLLETYTYLTLDHPSYVGSCQLVIFAGMGPR